MNDATQPPGSSASQTWDFFIAHAGGDVLAAEELYKNLYTRTRTFLDSKCLKPGDDWSLELPRAQESSRITVVLVSRNTEGAYYQREEIAAAIDAARRRPEERRVVPVYLDAHGAERVDLPYGLRIRHSISLRSSDSMAGVAAQLIELLSTPVDDSGSAAKDFLHFAVTGFVGRTRRGPMHGSAVAVTSYAEFVSVFGLPLEADLSFLGYAVRGFFENGGRDARIVRVAPANATAASVQIPGEDGSPSLVVRSRDVGSWGNGVRIEVSEGTRLGVHVSVYPAESPADAGPLEDYDNLDLNPIAPNYLAAEINNRSTLVYIEPVGAPDRRLQFGNWMLIGGRDGDAPAVQDYAAGEAGSSDGGHGLTALDAADIALICVPDAWHPSLPAAERDRLQTIIATKS